MMLIKHQCAGPWALGEGVLSGDGRGKRIRLLIPGYGVSRKRTSSSVRIRECFMEDAMLQLAGL